MALPYVHLLYLFFNIFTNYIKKEACETSVSYFFYSHKSSPRDQLFFLVSTKTKLHLEHRNENNEWNHLILTSAEFSTQTTEKCCSLANKSSENCQICHNMWQICPNKHVKLMTCWFKKKEKGLRYLKFDPPHPHVVKQLQYNRTMKYRLNKYRNNCRSSSSNQKVSFFSNFFVNIASALWIILAVANLSWLNVNLFSVSNTFWFLV